MSGEKIMLPEFGYCIRCGRKIGFSPNYPYCIICGGNCSSANRFSASDLSELFCHGCRDQAYISSDVIFCEQCQKKYMNLNKN
jgi:hypothetical protein